VARPRLLWVSLSSNAFSAGRNAPLVGLVSRSDLMRLFMTARWVCENCGYFARGFERPDPCPNCGSDRVVFQREGEPQNDLGGA